MTPPADDRNRLAADLGAYLRQQRESGVEWFIDPGAADDSAAAAPVPAPGPAAAPPAPVKSAPAKAARPAAARPPAAPAAPAAPKDDPFPAVRDAFVQETLGLIARRREAEPAADIFNAPAAAPARLTPEQKRGALDELAREVAPCTQCKLARTRTQTVFGTGNPDAGVVFVGEAPGREEDERGEPFVGRAGQLLNDILKAIALRREDVYICNILKCRPPENRDPEADEVEACEPYLKRQLEIIDPSVICCLGRHAAHTLLRANATLGALREHAHFYGRVPVVVTYHPAALLRNPHWKRPAWDDVRKLRALYDALQQGR